MHIWCVRLDVSSRRRARLYATLGADERSRAARFRFERDRRHFIVAHGALRDLLGRYLEIEAGRIRYVYNAFGKPDLDPTFGGRLRFNLSHSGGLALIAIAAESSVGVDLEFARAQSDYRELARCFFSTSEVDQLNALPSDRYAEAVIGCWAKKEAVLKAGGRGLAMPLNSFAVPVAIDPAQGPADLHVASGDIDQPMHWSVFALRPAPGYVGALAIEGSGWRLSQCQWTTVAR